MSDFVEMIPPLGRRLDSYDRTKLSSEQDKRGEQDKTILQSFLNALSVREEVFVQEQGVPLENELDEDDARSFHWVAYASVGAPKTSPEQRPADSRHNTDAARRQSTGNKLAIGAIRLVPAPHAAHPLPGMHHKIDARDTNGGKHSSEVHDMKEAYVKLGRLCVLKDYRNANIPNLNIGRLLIGEAVMYAQAHPEKMVPSYDPVEAEAKKHEADVGLHWKGLVLIHAQVPAVKFWLRQGFKVDESMGTWDEEGIDHVAMWRRLDVVENRRISLVAL